MKMYQVGMSRCDITAYEPEMSMLGWGQDFNRVTGVGQKLYVRSMVVKGPEGPVAYVCAELCFISMVIRQEVLRILQEQYAEHGFGPHNVMLTATHTHSGPDGISQYTAYNGNNYGFSMPVFTYIVQGIVKSIIQAEQSCVAATIRTAQVEVPHDEPVAFQRSLKAYNANWDVKAVRSNRTELATDRVMTILRVDSLEGRVLGLISWFPVHGTSVHSDNTLLHSDNKGCAALQLEAELSKEWGDFVAIFAQESAGDVTPNHRFDKRRGLVVGESPCDYENAKNNGSIQAKYALQAFRKAARSLPLDLQGLGGVTEHLCFAEPASGQSRGVVGIGMALGTAEGPGPLHPIRGLIRGATNLRRWLKVHFGLSWEAKIPFLKASRGFSGKIAGLMSFKTGLKLLANQIEVVHYLHALACMAGDEQPLWLPASVPVQLLRLGAFTIVGMPCEPTTVVGRRLRQTLCSSLRLSAEQVVINGYANGYCGYVTTPEEYEFQYYEGANTYFGRETLSLYQASLQRLAKTELKWGAELVVGPELDAFRPELLEKQRRLGRQHMKGLGTKVAGILCIT